MLGAGAGQVYVKGNGFIIWEFQFVPHGCALSEVTSLALGDSGLLSQMLRMCFGGSSTFQWGFGALQITCWLRGMHTSFKRVNTCEKGEEWVGLGSQETFSGFSFCFCFK